MLMGYKRLKPSIVQNKCLSTETLAATFVAVVVFRQKRLFEITGILAGRGVALVPVSFVIGRLIALTLKYHILSRDLPCQ